MSKSSKILLPIIVDKKEEERRLLEKWLKSECDYGEPNYTKDYQSLFGIDDISKMIYKKDDIDCKCNTLYINGMYDDDIVLSDKDEKLKHYVDHAYINDEIYDILIPPNTNQSNANYFYKLLLVGSQEHSPYNIPYVPDNPKIPFNGKTKKLRMVIDKISTYKFVYDESI